MVSPIVARSTYIKSLAHINIISTFLMAIMSHIFKWLYGCVGKWGISPCAILVWEMNGNDVEKPSKIGGVPQNLSRQSHILS